MSKIENLNELHAVEEWAVDRTESWTVVVRNRWGTVSLIASDEDGDLFFQRIPTDDEDDVPAGYVDKVPGVDTGWPLELLWPLGTREDDWGVYERIDAPFTHSPGHEPRSIAEVIGTVPTSEVLGHLADGPPVRTQPSESDPT